MLNSDVVVIRMFPFNQFLQQLERLSITLRIVLSQVSIQLVSLVVREDFLNSQPVPWLQKVSIQLVSLVVREFTNGRKIPETKKLSTVSIQLVSLVVRESSIARTSALALASSFPFNQFLQQLERGDNDRNKEPI